MCKCIMLGERFLTVEMLNKIYSGKLSKNPLIGWYWENQFNLMIKDSASILCPFLNYSFYCVLQIYLIGL